MNAIFHKLIDYFTHPSFRTQQSLYERSKMLIIVLLVVFTMLFLYTSYFLINGVAFNAKAIQNYFACLSTVVCLFVLKKSGNLQFPMYYLAIMGFFFVSASAYMSGGIYSNDISWYFVIPVITLMLIGKTEGIIASLFSLFCTGAFYLLEINKHKDFIADSVAYGLGYKFTNSFFILALLVLVIYTLVTSNKKLQNIIQNDREQQLRENIARDFHDQIGNKLASIQHLSSLSKMNKSADEKEVILTKIGENAKEVYENFKDFIWTKDPESRQWKELFMYLHDYAEDYLKHASINLIINADPEDLTEVILPAEWSRHIVPLFKEIITNASKHANANNIYVDFIFKNRTIAIVVKDDGIGLDNAKGKNGYGLKNLYSRAEAIGAKLTIESELNSYTKISFSAQLPQ
jgi:signal transduction histidine kinase